jgi:hypothetical protein
MDFDSDASVPRETRATPNDPSSATAERGAARAQPWHERQTPKCSCRSARRKHAP